PFPIPSAAQHPALLSLPTRRSSDLELHEQHGRDLERELAVPVDGVDSLRVEQFDARDRHAHLDDLDGRAHGRLDVGEGADRRAEDRKSTRLNSSHVKISYAVFCLKK